MADRTLGTNLSAPSISHGAENLYMRGVLEEATRDNLSKVGPTHCIKHLCIYVSQDADMG